MTVALSTLDKTFVKGVDIYLHYKFKDWLTSCIRSSGSDSNRRGFETVKCPENRRDCAGITEAHRHVAPSEPSRIPGTRRPVTKREKCEQAGKAIGRGV